MGISNLTALTIQPQNNIQWGAGEHKETGKYAGFIWLSHENGDFSHYLVSTKPIYDSVDDAENAMKEIVEKVRADESLDDWL